MISNDAVACTQLHLLSPADHADTTAATGAWTDITAYQGRIVVTQCVGVVTAGTLAGKIQHADDGSGTNAADITGATFSSVGTSTDLTSAKLVVQLDGLKPYIRYVGTIATGPAVVGVTALATAKYV